VRGGRAFVENEIASFSADRFFENVFLLPELEDSFFFARKIELRADFFERRGRHDGYQFGAPPLGDFVGVTPGEPVPPVPAFGLAPVPCCGTPGGGRFGAADFAGAGVICTAGPARSPVGCNRQMSRLFVPP